MEPLYDRIGIGYGERRRADPRIAEAIAAALGKARTVANVGAGTGSYEPRDRRVVAIEPSAEMIRQRPLGSAPAVQARAEQLPLRDAAVDAALAVLTVHHWSDRATGLAELRRVARHRVVVFTWDPACRDAFWLTREYLPAMLALDVPRFPPLPELGRILGELRVETVPVPRDCQDGFLGAFWGRPEAYLVPEVRRGISSFAQFPAEAGLARLAEDLRSGRWDARFGALRRQPSADLGYRLVVARGRSG